jgi:hypothetical protein
MMLCDDEKRIPKSERCNLFIQLLLSLTCTLTAQNRWKQNGWSAWGWEEAAEFWWRGNRLSRVAPQLWLLPQPASARTIPRNEMPNRNAAHRPQPNGVKERDIGSICAFLGTLGRTWGFEPPSQIRESTNERPPSLSYFCYADCVVLRIPIFDARWSDGGWRSYTLIASAYQGEFRLNPSTLA